MALFLKNKLFLNSLFVVSGIVWGLALTCENAPTNTVLKRDGGIYGFLRVESTTQALSPTLATVFIEGTNVFAKPDSTGFFYFPEVKPGKYTLVGRAPGFADYIIEGVEVEEDSISITTMAGLVRQSFPERQVWGGVKIKKVDIRRKGSMAGRVYDSDTDEGIPKAYIIIKGTDWGTMSDSLGNYRIADLLPGKYTVFSGTVGYRRAFIDDVQIIPDSTLFMNFRLINAIWH